MNREGQQPRGHHPERRHDARRGLTTQEPALVLAGAVSLLLLIFATNNSSN